MNILKTTLTAGVIAFSAQVAVAGAILIDDFSVYQQVVDAPNVGDVNTSTFGGIGDLGADRTMSIATSGGGLDASTFTSTGASGVLPPNALTLANDPGQASTATLVYDFGGTVDLTMMGGNYAFFFEFPGGVLGGDVVGTTFSTTVNSASGSGTETEALTPATSQFTTFDNADFAGVDFENVTSLVFTFNSVPNFDGSLLSISAVPLPASALLLLFGVGGIGAVGARRRRRAS